MSHLDHTPSWNDRFNVLLFRFVVIGTMSLTGCRSTSPEPLTRYQHPHLHTTSSPSFVVATYNVFGLRKHKELGKTMEALPFVDVWALQEVHERIGVDEELEPFHSRELPAALRALFPQGEWHGFYIPMNEEKAGLWEGMAVLSRIPFEEAVFHPLPSPNRKQRVAQEVMIRIAGHPVRIYHTDHDVGLIGVPPQDRAAQVEALIQTAARPEITSASRVLVGDFNPVGIPLWPFALSSKGEGQRLRETFAKAGYGAIPEAERPTYTFRKLWMRKTLDYQFYQGLIMLEWGVTQGYLGSDHRPVWVRYALK